jgi:4-amino-4-deoxy-L-arabinose transferase-like glycosyltransferase
VACGLFITLGALLIPLAGLQSDEALFGAPLYPNINNYLWTRPWRLNIPVMEMSYLGSLKSFLYLPIFQLLGANLWTIRLPMVLLGSLTVFMFYKLASNLGRNPAILGAFLLATDPLFLLTNTFDWGPVALEHFFLVTGCWCIYQFGTRPADSGSTWHSRVRFLALGSLCFGLALWNKAIFLWALAGLSVATLIVFWPWVRRELTARNLRIALAAFLLGASPFVYYNIRHPLATFSENAHFEPEAVASKWTQLEAGLQGNSLFGYIASEEWMEPAKPVGGLSAAIRDAVGPLRNTGFYYVLGALLVLVPLWWRSRAAWFSLIFMAVAWIWMALTHDAGASAHHVVLLWPFPIVFAIAALRRLPRSTMFLAGVLLAGSNLLIVNQYFYQLQRNGAFNTFTDAILPLSDSLDESHTLYITDWGLFDSLNLLHRGRLQLRLASGPLTPDNPSAEEAADVQRMLQDPKGLFLGHVKALEVYPNVGAHLDAQARTAGLRREIVRTIPDSNGRPIFEISRVVPD